MILPSLLTLWTLFVLYERWHGYWSDAGYGILALVCGALIGWQLIRYWKIQVDREHKILILPGSWLTLVLALLMFSVRYGFGFYYDTRPVITHPVFIADLVISGVLMGMFIGRAINLWNRYRRG